MRSRATLLRLRPISPRIRTSLFEYRTPTQHQIFTEVRGSQLHGLRQAGGIEAPRTRRGRQLRRVERPSVGSPVVPFRIGFRIRGIDAVPGQEGRDRKRQAIERETSGSAFLAGHRLVIFDCDRRSINWG